MKVIVAFVHPSRAPRVIHALERVGLYHLSFSRVHGVLSPSEPIVRAELASEGSTEVRLEAYCAEGLITQTAALIRETARVGDFPSGAVFVHPVDEAWNIGDSVPR